MLKNFSTLEGKPSKEKVPVVTVVTVVYNADSDIGDTMDSVIEQTYSNLEYIVIDGGSTDGTKENIEFRLGDVDQYVSEADSGIYDAMNKAIVIATGEWIIFMNAGDRFVSANTVSKVFDRVDLEASDFIYGDHFWCSNAGQDVLVEARPLCLMWQRISFSHQALFARTSLMKLFKFDLKYSVVSDYEFYYKCYKQGARFGQFNAPIARVSSEGFSDVNFFLRTKERWAIARKYESAKTVDIFYFNFLVKHYISRALKCLSWLLNKLRS